MEKKSIILICVSLLVVVGLFFASNMTNKGEKNKDKYKDKIGEIKVKDYGSIIVELDYENAPLTVENFVSLVEDGFYDGLTFHRIIEGFMAQGGGYEIDGSRKPAKTIKGEFKSNGVTNNISHKRGVISMARAKGSNTASSEFFITQADSLHLDGKYAAFGYVIEGMDVVDKIAKKAKPTDDNGSIEVKDRPVIEYIKVVEK